MRRGGYSLTEVTLAAALAAVVLAAVMAALSHVSRGWRRADAGMARGQAGQRILERLAEDLAHVDGRARPTATALARLEFPGDATEFRMRERPALHVINAYHQGTADPRHSAEHAFVQRQMLAGVPPEPVYDPEASRYVGAPPPSNVLIPPMVATESVIVVKDPPDKPRVTWMALSLGRGVEEEQVLWVFARERHGSLAPGTILRHGSITGLWTMTKTTPLAGEVDLRDQWLWVRTPAGHEGGEVFEVMLDVTLRAPHDPNLPSDPGFMTRRTITAGM